MKLIYALIKKILSDFRHSIKYFKHSPIKVMIMVALILLVINVSISWNYYTSDSENFIVQLLAEGHGMVLDIFLLGALLLWVNESYDRKKTIENAIQEISDLSQCLKITDDDGFNEVLKLINKDNVKQNEIDAINQVYNNPAQHDSYACLRIIRNIRTLNRYEITKINLDFTELPKAALKKSNLTESSLIGFRSIMGDFSFSKMNGCTLNSANLSLANFTECEMVGVRAQGAVFTNALLVGADLRNSILINSNFRNARLNRADLTGADLFGVDFTGAHLFSTNLIGCKNLKASQLMKAKILKGCLMDDNLEREYLEMKSKLEQMGRQVKINTGVTVATNVQPETPYSAQKAAG